MDKLPIDSKFVHWVQPYDKNVVANLIDSNAMLTTSHVKVDPVYDLTPRVADMMSSTIHQWNHNFDSIGAFLRQQGRVSILDIDEKDVKWKLMGKGSFHARVVENVNENIEFVGVGGAEFELKLDVDWWDSGDVIAPVAGIYKINVQIVSKYQDGTSTVYRCVLVDSADDAFLRQSFLEVGKEWTKLFASAGEATSRRGSIVFEGDAPTWVELRNKMTHLTGTVKITDEALKTSQIILSQERKFAIQSGGSFKPNPKQPVFLMDSLQAKFISQVQRQEQRALLYSRHNANKIIDPSSGYVVDQGAGLFEFLQTGNQIELPVTSYAIDILIDAIKQRWYNRVQYGNRGNIMIWTGEGGLELVQEFFDRKVTDARAQINLIDITTGGATTYGSGYEGRKFRTSYITEYQMFPWGSIKFGHLPLLDDLQLNGGGPTYKGRPHSSYMFIAMDIGIGTGAGSNIQLLKRRGMTNYNYVCGMIGPAGPINNMRNVKNTNWTNGAHAGNYFELHYDDFTGIVMKDASLSIFGVPALATE